MDQQPTQPKFRDLEGHEYTLRLTIATVRTIRDETEIDFGVPEQFAQYYAELLAEDELAVRVLESAVGVKNLECVLDGELLEHAINALTEAVVLFTRPQKRGLVTDALKIINDHWIEAVGDGQTVIRNFTKEKAKAALAQLGS